MNRKFSGQLIKSLACLTLAFVPGACHVGKNDARTKIYGGKPVPAAGWAGAVALLRYQSVDCSGVLVHPRLVITAAHCVGGADETLEIYMGTGDDEQTLQGQGRPERIVPSPKFGPGPKGYNDIAYILLKEPMPIDPRDIVPVLSHPAEIEELMQPGIKAHIVGFGQRENELFGSKYEAEVAIQSVGDSEVKLGGDGRDACKGDSGGPAYSQLKDGSWRVFGIVSRGKACGKGGTWTRIDAHLCWVQSDSGIDLNLPAGICEGSTHEGPQQT